MAKGAIAQDASAAAERAWQAGDLAAVRAACETLVALEPNSPRAHEMLAFVDMPGPGYREVLAQIHEALRPKIYVEVGVSTGASLRLVGPQTRAIGIDPAPQLTEPLGANIVLLAMTSDEAFVSPQFQSALSGQAVDLAFIDGMHQCEFALRDFINLERLSHRQSTILMHDCYPLNRLTAQREQRTAFWSGDTWRLVPILKKYRPELLVRTVATAPTGLAIVRGLDPSSTLLRERYDEIVAEMLALDYRVLEGRKPEVLNRCANEWGEIAAALAA